jgi:hypothetical protein
MYDFKSAFSIARRFRFRISRISTVSNSLAQRVFGSRASASFCPSARVRSAVRNNRLWFTKVYLQQAKAITLEASETLLENCGSSLTFRNE